MLAVFLRPNGNSLCGERGGDSGVHLESWRKMLCSENRGKSTSLVEGLAPSRSSMCCVSASVSRSVNGSVEVVSPSNDLRGVASS
jgi:hypothetical protein